MAKLTPQQIKVAFAKAREAQQAGKLDLAERGYTKLLDSAPGLAEVHFNLAEIQTKKGRLPQAAQSFEAALKLRPAEPAIWVAYLLMASKHPNTKNFDILRNRAKPLLHRTPAFAYFEGLSCLREKNWQEAVRLFEVAIDGKFRTAQLHADYAVALGELGRAEDALVQFDAALALEPRSDLILYLKAEHFRKTGDLASAKIAAQAAIDAAPHMGGPYALYVSLGKVAQGDPNISKMRKALATKRAKDLDVTTLCAALAKAMEDTGETAQVFRYLNRGNAVAAKAFPFDQTAARAVTDRLREAYAAIKDISVEPSKVAPIFVTGAPRSGTSLVEQIFSAHSQVAGGGELGLLQPKVGAALKEDTSGGEAVLQQLKHICDDFGDQLSKLFPSAGRVTDKSISTFSYIGFLHKVMPNARFVLVQRDPRDNAVSIYKNRFQDGLHRYSNDLSQIAFFLRQFEEFSDLWRQECPDAIHQIRYEDLIADPEAKSKELIASAGLDWEDACLSFYEAKRTVKTLSSAQVRQPIYSSSVGAWQKYERDLEPFLKAYGPID